MIWLAVSVVNGVFRTQVSLYDETFSQKLLTGKTHKKFLKKLYLRRLTKSWMLFWVLYSFSIDLAYQKRLEGKLKLNLAKSNEWLYNISRSLIWVAAWKNLRSGHPQEARWRRHQVGQIRSFGEILGKPNAYIIRTILEPMLARSVNNLKTEKSFNFSESKNGK